MNQQTPFFASIVKKNPQYFELSESDLQGAIKDTKGKIIETSGLYLETKCGRTIEDQLPNQLVEYIEYKCQPKSSYQQPDLPHIKLLLKPLKYYWDGEAWCNFRTETYLDTAMIEKSVRKRQDFYLAQHCDSSPPSSDDEIHEVKDAKEAQMIEEGEQYDRDEKQALQNWVLTIQDAQRINSVIKENQKRFHEDDEACQTMVKVPTKKAIKKPSQKVFVSKAKVSEQNKKTVQEAKQNIYKMLNKCNEISKEAERKEFLSKKEEIELQKAKQTELTLRKELPKMRKRDASFTTKEKRLFRPTANGEVQTVLDRYFTSNSNSQE